MVWKFKTKDWHKNHIAQKLGTSKVFKQQVKWNQLSQCILFQIAEFLGFQGLRDFLKCSEGLI